MFSIFDGRGEFYQWDLDRKLIVNDKTIKQVHFCNRTGECSLVRVPYEVNGVYLVDVPNVILQNDLRINVYGYDANYTKHSDKFNVVKRSKPESYIYTDEEVRYWEEATAMAEEAQKTAEQATQDAYNAFSKTLIAVEKTDAVKAEVDKLAVSLGNLYMDEKQGEVVEIKDMRGSVQELVSYIDGYTKPANPNLLPDDIADESNWVYGDEVGVWSYTLPKLPAGTYTVWHNEPGCYLYCYGGEVYSNEPYTFTLKEEKIIKIDTFDYPFYVKLEVGTKHTDDDIILANLIPVDLTKSTNWNYSEEAGISSYWCKEPLPAGTYTIYVDEKYSDLYINFDNGGSWDIPARTPLTFTLKNSSTYTIYDWSGGTNTKVKMERGSQFTGWADSNPNLIPAEYASGQSMWPYYEELGGCVLVLEDIPEGNYTLYHENDWADYLYIQEGSGDEFQVNYEEPYTFYHYGGNISIFDYSYGATFHIIKLEAGEEYTGTNYYTYDTEFNKVELTVNDTVYTAEISPTVYGYYDWVKGQLHYDDTVENYEPVEVEVRNNSTLSSSTGETRIVYGRDLTSVIEELQYAIISLGGNV